MKAKVGLIARILLGLIYAVFGANGFLNFIPPPPDMPANVGAFFTAMMATGYFFPVVKGTETICGILLLAGVAVPAVLVILAPITLQILLFHAFMTPGISNLVIPLIMLALHVTAMMKYKDLYKPLFCTKKC